MNRELDFVKAMFDRIAPWYDFLNRLLSLHRDTIWRSEMVRAARPSRDDRILDVACGTCDVALEASARLRGRVMICGLDFSYGMLALGQKKLRQRRNQSISLVNGDALCLPLRPGRFDAVFIAFGIRNIMDRAEALQQFHTVLKPGGRLAVLELTTPQKPWLRKLYHLYSHRALPAVGRFFSKDRQAYQYLPDSILRFPGPVEFAGIMGKAGFTDIRFKPMTFGIVTLFIGVKP